MTTKNRTIDIMKMKEVRKLAIDIENQIDILTQIRQRLIIDLVNVQGKCKHKLVAKYNDGELGLITCCLNCNKKFYGEIIGEEFVFENIIDIRFLDSTTNKDKASIALEMFEQEKTKNPNASDTEIVNNINHKNSEPKQEFVKSLGIK